MQGGSYFLQDNEDRISACYSSVLGKSVVSQKLELSFCSATKLDPKYTQPLKLIAQLETLLQPYLVFLDKGFLGHHEVLLVPNPIRPLKTAYVACNALS